MNSPAPLATKTDDCDSQSQSQSQSSYSIVPLLHVDKHAVQTYFQQMAVHDTLKYRFSDIDEPQWEDVIGVIQRMGRGMYLVQDSDSNIVAEFTLENFTGQSAQSHFSTHPEIKTQERLAIGRYCVNYILNEWVNPATKRPFLRSLYGLTPLPNRAGCIFALKIGYRKLGVLPGGCTYMGKTEDAMISVASSS